MCVGFWSLEHPDYALILCGNRDEYLSRPTTAAHFHGFEMDIAEQPGGNVLSGRDLSAGGTWLGVNRAGRVAFLTNITEEHLSYTSTRGALASAFLLPDRAGESLQDHVGHVVRENRAYAGFNLLLFGPRASASAPGGVLSYDAACVTNRGGGGTITCRPLADNERRCGALSNGVEGQGAEAWPKVCLGSSMFSDVLQFVTPETTEADLVQRLFHLLTSWRSEHPPRARAELRNTIQIEPMQVRASETSDGLLYGTRLSTIILVRRDGSVSFYERDIWVLDERGQPTKGDEKNERVFKFRADIPNTQTS
ncbi:uncharacterized protein PHACADRAFT_128288 [Phanerochaete carnosa HHB-10118-sp]|uniref:DUF833-domain-containing protein n=1 Tax=Phanerochaete carnosa (strain HHB-10118-sp) TaxID=650164 RepID=K5UQK4_PHACS|nr:uncharacterized protein PHACADRAFT_128288 [Phanerochaete carnosa HHB-10118-sp]EKM52111.1 hypothetical protein PHACADRAFT_128288 [Phanerochaete carnosa HHB-10118-sp]